MTISGRLSHALALGAAIWLLHIGTVFADDGTEDVDNATTLETPVFSRPGLHGRLILDGASYNNDKTVMDSGGVVSSARISINGKIKSTWDYVLQYEFAGKGSLKNAWLRNRLADSGRVRVGQFQEPFSLDELTSSRYSTFIENALPTAFSPGSHMGISFDKHGQLGNISTGLFGESANSYASNPTDGGWGASMRITTSPDLDDRQLFHLGLSASYRKAGNKHTLRFHSHPETSVTTDYLVNTGKIRDVDSHSLIGLEGAWVGGPWTVQTEYMRADVNRTTGSDLVFSGGYIFASWFVTGESRPYSKHSGTFGRVIPKNGGALELAARYSSLNLADSSVHGGKERNITLGVNYYFNPYVRCMAEYVLINVDSRSGSEHPRALLARLQYDF